jgi:hypothetical protein
MSPHQLDRTSGRRKKGGKKKQKGDPTAYKGYKDDDGNPIKRKPKFDKSKHRGTGPQAEKVFEKPAKKMTMKEAMGGALGSDIELEMDEYC